MHTQSLPVWETSLTWLAEGAFVDRLFTDRHVDYIYQSKFDDKNASNDNNVYSQGDGV